MLQLGAGMEERSTANVRHGGVSADGRLAYRVWGKAFQRDDSAPAGALAVDDSWHMLRSGFRVDYRMSETDALMVSADANAGDVGQSLTYTRSPPPPIRETVYDRPDVSGANLLSRWTHQFAGGSELDAQLYRDHFHRVESVLQGDINNADLDIQHRFSSGAHKIVWGSGLRRTSDEFGGSFTMSLDPASRTTYLLSAFIHDEVQIVPERVRLGLGTKVEHNSYSDFEWQPNVRVLWTPSRQHTIWGAVSRAVRTPSRGDHDFQAITAAVPADSLLEGAPAALFRLEGNRDFDSEKLSAFDAGYRTSLFGAVLVDVAVFYNRYNDHLTIEPVPGLPLVEGDRDSPYWVIPLKTANLAKATTYGFETSLEWVMQNDWRLRAIYSYLEIDIDLAEGSLDQSSQDFDGDSPNHQLGVRVMSRLPTGIQLYTAGRYVGVLPRPGIDSYVEADVRLSRRIGEGVEFSVTGRNLLSSRHREAVSNTVGAVNAEVERDFQVSLRWELR